MSASKTVRVLGSLIALLTWCGLALQFYLTVFHPVIADQTTSRVIVNYFSYFTISTNLLAALILTFWMWFPKSVLGEWSGKPATTAAVATYMAMVGAGYSLLLRNVWAPQGWQKVADVVLHDATPLMLVAFWIFLAPKKALEWKSILYWTIYPIVYLVYSLVRGPIAGWFPYFFLNTTILGYSRVFLNIAFLVLAFLILASIAILFSRYRTRRIASLALSRLPRGFDC